GLDRGPGAACPARNDGASCESSQVRRGLWLRAARAGREWLALLAWSLLRARGCHESPPVRRSRRVPRAVGTAALMALLLRDENHHAVLVGLPSFEVWPDRGRPESDARRKQRRRNYGNDETIQHDAACACVSRGKLRQEALAVTADLQNKPRKPQSRWNSPPKPC